MYSNRNISDFNIVLSYSVRAMTYAEICRRRRAKNKQPRSLMRSKNICFFTMQITLDFVVFHKKKKGL